MTHPILAQGATEVIKQTIEAGNFGLAVLLTVVLLVSVGGMALLIRNVITPLMKQLIELITSQKEMVASASKAVEHSNETNRLVTLATNEQTGELRLLRKDFSAYQTLQTDTTAQLVDRFDSFDTQLEGLKKLIESNAGDHKEILDALLKMAEGMKAVHDDVRRLLPAPTPPTTNIVNVNPPAPDTKPDSSTGATAA